MFEKFKQRSHRLEYIDTGNYTPEEYEDCISEMRFVNRWMGDTHSLKATLLRDVGGGEQARQIVISMPLLKPLAFSHRSD